MSYVIFNTDTNRLYSGNRGAVEYRTERGAKIAATRLNNQTRRCRYLVWEIGKYRTWAGLEPIKIKRVRNLMSGAEIEIPEDTPHCCDTSTETYWSM